MRAMQPAVGAGIISSHRTQPDVYSALRMHFDAKEVRKEEIPEI